MNISQAAYQTHKKKPNWGCVAETICVFETHALIDLNQMSHQGFLLGAIFTLPAFVCKGSKVWSCEKHPNCTTFKFQTIPMHTQSSSFFSLWAAPMNGLFRASQWIKVYSWSSQPRTLYTMFEACLSLKAHGRIGRRPFYAKASDRHSTFVLCCKTIMSWVLQQHSL